jgi:hypothetical protein
MKLILNRYVAALLVASLTSSAALAHHSFAANFDLGDSVEIEGVIASVIWRNPHVRIMVTVDAGSDSEQVWEIESHSLSNLHRMDVTRDVVVVGDTVKIAGYPARRNDQGMFMLHMLLTDGREALFQPGLTPLWSNNIIGSDDVLYGKVEELDETKRPTTMFAVWTTNYSDRGSWPLFPITSENYPLTDAAKAKMATYDVELDTPLANCAPKGMPSAMAQPYPIQLIDENDRIFLKIEEYDAVREIHITDVHDAGGIEPSILGYSTGNWDEGTLVVTTTNISFGFFDVLALPIFVPQSDAMHVVETFKLRAGGNYLDYTMVVTDPATISEPVTFGKFWKWRPGAMIQPYECEDS